MRPLRLLLSLLSSLIAITLLLYFTLGARRNDTPLQTPSSPVKKSKLKAFWSFTSPASFFPPSAVISLTDDNSTFFLARPAAFGPLLPSQGLSGPLWIGSGFGDDTMGRGELGCSDVPGWSDGDQNPGASSNLGLDSKRNSFEASDNEGARSSARRTLRSKRSQDGATTKNPDKSRDDDGTDDYLHHPLPASEMAKSHSITGEGKNSEHADIQSLQEGAEIAGKVVLLKRGGCGFLEKVKWAQRRGGVALIVGDDVRGGALVQMYAHGDTSNVTIPALFTSHTTAHLLSSLLPTGGLLQDLSPEDAAKLGLGRGKGSKNSKSKNDSGNKQESVKHPTSTRIAGRPTRTPKAGEENPGRVEPTRASDVSDHSGWFRSFLYALGFGNPGSGSAGWVSRRPPSSGNIDWVLVEDWDDQRSNQKPIKTRPTVKPTSTSQTAPVPATDDFVIGEQDWRDPDLLPKHTSAAVRPADSGRVQQQAEARPLKGGSILPGSGEYTKDGHLKSEIKGNGQQNDHEEHPGWLKNILHDAEANQKLQPAPSRREAGDTTYLETKKEPSKSHAVQNEDETKTPDHHEGLWVTLTPTNMSGSPLFDTLLVLVVSPLVTLTVVYALLLLRSRIRRRRWRAPKSVVDRLPVRTYHTISDSSPARTPASPSLTTPLLQNHSSQSRPTSSVSRPRSRTASEVPAASSSFKGGRSPEEEKREAGLAEWRRRYGGRQKECVVCLEEYVDGVSRVMSLPCGHEFHADCITPWLVTRRRTCPICKGDVVRSLSQVHHDRHSRSSSSSHSPNYNDDSESLQAQAAETRNDSPSASRPIDADFGSDVEANWLDDRMEADDHPRTRENDSDGDSGAGDLGFSIREVGVSIRRGFSSLRGALGLQRRENRADVDRDR
ncbi:hypothetical protein GQ43DRAFT_447626 [Delitschia confertaspora ATCC 74209]|uniref:RING-type E3 ubiquitin transferase n=1 Tax=Delitschia confertaspora ATCC 74209 TaxID=1513339 RepID=A0A9P4MUK1_9PLEO|nr:hypothetical protein GQ43DRAFT_447626 [Delitschia confertaspora ATCC 74209]